MEPTSGLSVAWEVLCTFGWRSVGIGTCRELPFCLHGLCPDFTHLWRQAWSWRVAVWSQARLVRTSGWNRGPSPRNPVVSVSVYSSLPPCCSSFLSLSARGPGSPSSALQPVRPYDHLLFLRCLIQAGWDFFFLALVLRCVIKIQVGIRS